MAVCSSLQQNCFLCTSMQTPNAIVLKDACIEARRRSKISFKVTSKSAKTYDKQVYGICIRWTSRSIDQEAECAINQYGHDIIS